MIRPLRNRHRLLWILLALVVPPVFVLGLTARQDVPRLQSDLLVDGQVLLHGGIVNGRLLEGMWSGQPVEVRIGLYGGTVDELAWGIRADLRKGFAVPGPVVYWSEEASDGSILPAESILVGVPSSSAPILGLPRTFSDENPGHLHLYSLGHARMVASGAVQLPEASK